MTDLHTDYKPTKAQLAFMESQGEMKLFVPSRVSAAKTRAWLLEVCKSAWKDLHSPIRQQPAPPTEKEA